MNLHKAQFAYQVCPKKIFILFEYALVVSVYNIFKCDVFSYTAKGVIQ